MSFCSQGGAGATGACLLSLFFLFRHLLCSALAGPWNELYTTTTGGHES